MKMKLNKNSILILLAAPVLLGSAVETPGADAAKAAAADTFAFAAIDTSLYVVKDTAVYLPAPLCDSSLVGKSIFDLLQGVELRQNVSIRTAMAEHIRLNAGRKISGYRIRIYFDNRQNALRILKSRLYDLELKKRQEKHAELEGQKKKIEWGSQIRSYVLHPYKMVKDLRTGHETSDTQAVLDGDLNEFMKVYLMSNNNN